MKILVWDFHCKIFDLIDFDIWQKIIEMTVIFALIWVLSSYHHHSMNLFNLWYNSLKSMTNLVILICFCIRRNTISWIYFLDYFCYFVGLINHHSRIRSKNDFLYYFLVFVFSNLIEFCNQLVSHQCLFIASHYLNLLFFKS